MSSRAASVTKRAQSYGRAREYLWAGLSLVTLVICWDYSMRLDEGVQAAAFSSR